VLLVAAILLYSVTFNGVVSHLSAIMTDRGMSLRSSAKALSLLGGCGLAGRVCIGLVLDRLSATRVSLLLFLLTVAGLLLFSYGGASRMFVGVAVMGFAAGGESDITPYLLSRYFELRVLSTLYGLAWTAFATGTAIGPILMGKLYAISGSYLPGGHRLFAIPTLISAFLMWMMPSYQGPESDRMTATHDKMGAVA